MNNLHDTPFAQFVWFIGVVEDIKDEMGVNRAKVRCLGYHSEDKSLVPTEALPWAFIMDSTLSMDGPMMVPSDFVVGFFLDGQEAQQPVIIGSMRGIPTAKDNSVGFSDPTGTYPKRLNDATTSPLSRGKDDDGVVAWKKGSVAPGEPPTAFAPVYPDNHVIETPKLNIIELDDTPGAERVHIFHKSGTFYEVHPDGKLVIRSVADAYEAILANKTLYVAGDLKLQAVGDLSIATNGNLKLSAGGDVKIAAGGSCDIGAGGKGSFVAGGVLDLNGSTVNTGKGSDGSGGPDSVPSANPSKFSG